LYDYEDAFKATIDPFYGSEKRNSFIFSGFIFN